MWNRIALLAICWLRRLNLSIYRRSFNLETRLEEVVSELVTRQFRTQKIPLGISLGPGESAEFTVVIDPRTGKASVEDIEKFEASPDFVPDPDAGLELRLLDARTKKETIN